jgi:hypothetical protein
MSRSDMRQRLLVNALASPELGHAERVFLIVASMLPAEYIDGRRRPGSAGMDERGWFALHYDYLARNLHTSPESVKKAAQRLAAKGWLFKRHPGTFGRPAGWQALDVRGDMSNRVTPGRFVPPYDLYAHHVRGDTVSPLPYRTPTDPSPAPAVGDFPKARTSVDGSNEHEGCRWHEHTRCPEDCAGHPTGRRESA